MWVPDVEAMRWGEAVGDLSERGEEGPGDDVESLGPDFEAGSLTGELFSDDMSGAEFDLDEDNTTAGGEDERGSCLPITGVAGVTVTMEGGGDEDGAMSKGIELDPPIECERARELMREPPAVIIIGAGFFLICLMAS